MDKVGLWWAEFCHNDTAYHTEGKTTPFKALYGRDPPRIVKAHKGDTAVSTVEDQLMERDAILDDLKAHLLQAQQKMKRTADKNRKDVNFLQTTFWKDANRPFQKLAARFYGPFLILQKVGKLAYKLQLPETAKIHSVFHISQLKKATENQIDWS